MDAVACRSRRRRDTGWEQRGAVSAGRRKGKKRVKGSPMLVLGVIPLIFGLGRSISAFSGQSGSSS